MCAKDRLDRMSAQPTKAGLLLRFGLHIHNS